MPLSCGLQIRALAEKQGRLLLIVNAQWNESGQIVSDFGIGPWKARAYEFLDTFEPSYSLIEKRIGAPGTWHIIFAMAPRGMC